MLKVENLTVRFGGLVAINKLSFEVKQGSIHGLIGPNGAGKTTVFNSIFKIVPYDGTINFKGNDIRKYPTHTLPAMGITRTFQNLSIFSSMTVKENILVGLHAKTSSLLLKDLIGLYVDTEKELQYISKSLGVTLLLPTYAAFLPFGTLKMVELARALISGPELLLLDEPGAGLNLTEKEKLKGLIKEVKNKGITVLIVEHDMGIIMDVSDHITVMNFGEKIAEGSADEISHNQKVIEAYLGEEIYA